MIALEEANKKTALVLFLQTIVLEEAKAKMAVVLFLNMIVLEEAKTKLALVLFQARQAEQAKRREEKKLKEKQTEKAVLRRTPTRGLQHYPEGSPFPGGF